MPNEDKKEEALTRQFPQQLGIRASIVTRGLQHIIQRRIPAVAWSRPSLVGVLSDPSESPDSANQEKKNIYFECRLTNISESPQNLAEGVDILRRSRTTGEIISVQNDGFGFPASRIVVLPQSVFPPIQVGLSFPKSKSLDQCLKVLFEETCELLAYDEKFHTIIVISLDRPSLVGLPASYDKKRIRILEVDDEAPIRKIIRDMLVSAGYECISVPNGVDALALLRAGEKFDLLLNDLLNLPMDGIQLLESAKKEFPGLPVIMVTAIHDIDVVLAALQYGASDYLLKPFEREQLLVIVRQVLASRTQQKLTIAPWEQGLSKLIAPAIQKQLVVRTVDGTPKFIRDLTAGDIVTVERENKTKMLHLVERHGMLGAIESAPIERE